MNGYYELKPSSDGKFVFNLKAGNHEVILTSQTYTTKASALAGIDAVRAAGPVEANYEKKTAANGAPFFNLKASNGQVIGKSEMYSSEAARDKGIAAVIKNCPAEKVSEPSA